MSTPQLSVRQHQNIARPPGGHSAMPTPADSRMLGTAALAVALGISQRAIRKRLRKTVHRPPESRDWWMLNAQEFAAVVEQFRQERERKQESE